MSCRRRVQIFEEQVVKIDCCDKKELENLEKSIITAIEQKLEKLNILIRNCNVYSSNGLILVNDRYNVCADIKTVAEAFGLNIKEIQCTLRGKNYIISDDLLCVLKQLGRNFEFGKNIENQELSDIVSEILANNKVNIVINDDILKMVRNIKENGKYTYTKTRSVDMVYEDGYLEYRKEGEWQNDEKGAYEKLLNMSKEAQKTINQANTQLRDGTTKLIYTRAKQMGYSVQETKNGTQTQLVLVRYE